MMAVLTNVLMNKIGIILKRGSPSGKEVLDKLVPWLRQQHKEVVVIDIDEKACSVQTDLVIVLGGDGTLLSAARSLEGSDTFILGVNLGSLGFLTEVILEELYPSLEMIFEGQFVEDPRLMLKSFVLRRGNLHFQSTVLNDVIIHKATPSRLIKLEITINQQFVTSLRADGLIVASATGSTAYSLSSGGPIVHPRVDAMVLTPISPHTLTHRPVVVPSTAKIEVALRTRTEGPVVTFDGHEECSLHVDDVVCIQAAEKKLKLICSPHRNYYQVLRQKLKWVGE